MSEVSEPEFVRACSLDGELGNTAVSIYRGFIGCWSFMYERWESGAFFTQTKPPKGKQRSLKLPVSYYPCGQASLCEGAFNKANFARVLLTALMFKVHFGSE